MLLVSCVGPAASDAELCRDVITRVCLTPVCEVASTRLGVDGGSCQGTLARRTGCGADDFAFSTPSRERVLDCRTPLVQASAKRDAKPSCDDVSDFLRCADVAEFLGGPP